MHLHSHVRVVVAANHNGMPVQIRGKRAILNQSLNAPPLVYDIDDVDPPTNLQLADTVFMAADNNGIPLDEKQNGVF